MCSSGWSTFARARRARRRRKSARAISSSRRRCPTRRRPTAPTTSAISKARCSACLAKADYAGFAGRAAESKSRGHIRGIGFVELYRMHRLGRRRGRVPSRSTRTDDFTVLIGTQSNGQGHETAYAQVVAAISRRAAGADQGRAGRHRSRRDRRRHRRFALDPHRRRHGRPRARRSSRHRSKDLAADELEAAAADLEIVDGRIRIAGTDRSISYEEIAALPAATPEKRTAIESFTPPVATYPNGTHVCEVEIDPDTGRTRIACYVVVDDFGLTLNPLLLEGQVHGGIAQGAGQALMEGAVYDAEGQLLTASLMDYCVAARRRPAELRLRDAQRSLDHQSAGAQGRGRSRDDRLDPRRDERRRRRPLARLRDRPHRHAGDPVRGVQGDPQSDGLSSLPYRSVARRAALTRPGKPAILPVTAC